MLYYLLFWTLLGFIIHFYIIFGTNLLTEGPAQNCCFFPISEFRRKRISNGVQMEWNLRERDFRNEHDPEYLEWTSRNHRGGHDAGGRAYPPGRALHPHGPLVAPPTYFFLLYILMYSPNHQKHPRKPNSTAATFCIHEIPSWSLFRSSARGGIHHGGLLHHHHSPSDEVWVVYFRLRVHS